jgi:hypothetical protein
MKSGVIRGEWQHVSHATGDKLHGQVRYLTCGVAPGAGPGHPSGGDINQAYFGGEARWFANGAWEDGYWFDVVVEDHGEPGRNDTYHITVRKGVDPAANVSGAIVYQAKGTLGGGNIQLHAPNGGHPFVASTRPAWVANEP